MRLPGKTVSVITLVVVISLLGLVLLQASLLKSAAALKEQAFRQNVSAALNTVAQRLEITDAANRVLKVYNDSLAPGSDSLSCSVLVLNAPDSAVSGAGRRRAGSILNQRFMRVMGDTLLYSIITPQNVMIRMLPRETGLAVTLVDTFRTPGTSRVQIPETVGTGTFECRLENDSSMILTQRSPGQGTLSISRDLGKFGLVKRVVSSLTREEYEPIENRIQQSYLDSLIGANLRDSHIELPYVFGVVGDFSDSLRITNRRQYTAELLSSEFHAELFPSDIFAPPTELLLYFPDYRSYIRQQVQPLLLLTIAFMAVIVFCFAYTLRTIHRQRLFANRTVEFINNMTHEFKTPLSTVSLACDALLRPNGSRETSDVSRYGRMIQEENLRMQNQVEKILQMATLEDREYDLALTDVDVHEIIQKAVTSMAVRAEERGGQVSSELRSGRHVILADAVHLANIIHNLLENACKYSPDRPMVTVSTEDCSGGVKISVRDQGIGIPERDRKMVFEKYYRVASGDMQGVRGFGIGLSYVKLMTEALGGKVALESEEGKGTTVSLTFPTSN